VPLCETWYYELDSQPLEFLLKLSKSPILEPRLAVQKTYTNLADQAWALKVKADLCNFCNSNMLENMFQILGPTFGYNVMSQW